MPYSILLNSGEDMGWIWTKFSTNRREGVVLSIRQHRVFSFLSVLELCMVTNTDSKLLSIHNDDKTKPDLQHTHTHTPQLLQICKILHTQFLIIRSTKGRERGRKRLLQHILRGPIPAPIPYKSVTRKPHGKMCEQVMK